MKKLHLINEEGINFAICGQNGGYGHIDLTDKKIEVTCERCKMILFSKRPFIKLIEETNNQPKTISTITYNQPQTPLYLKISHKLSEIIYNTTPEATKKMFRKGKLWKDND